MNLKQKIKHLLRQKREDKWEITDTIIKAEDIIFGQSLNFAQGLYTSDDKYVCIRNYHMSCIYVREEQFDQFKELNFIYSEDKKLINLTRLRKWTRTRNCVAVIANKTVPPEVDIREIELCVIDDIVIYITRIIKLKPKDQLFGDLINLQIMKEKHFNN